MDKPERRRWADEIYAAVSDLVADEGGDADMCVVSVPSWIWDHEMSARERDEEMMEGWLAVDGVCEHTDCARITYQDATRGFTTTTLAPLSVPALYAMAEAVERGGTIDVSLHRGQTMTDRVKELQDHVREVAADRDAVLDKYRRIASWIKDNAAHPPTCGVAKGGDCTCNLANLLRDLT